MNNAYIIPVCCGILSIVNIKSVTSDELNDTFVPKLWESTREVLSWGECLQCEFFGGRGKSHPTKCSHDFLRLVKGWIDVEKCRGKELSNKSAYNSAMVLSQLFAKCVPGSLRLINNQFGVLKYLHQNDYVLDKAFVNGILVISKYLGPSVFPQGIHKWPPDIPPECSA